MHVVSETRVCYMWLVRSAGIDRRSSWARGWVPTCLTATGALPPSWVLPPDAVEKKAATEMMTLAPPPSTCIQHTRSIVIMQAATRTQQSHALRLWRRDDDLTSPM